MGQWMRWCPTCLVAHRRTAASWREPKGSGGCCGRSWNAGLPLGSFSTDQCTESTEERQRDRGVSTCRDSHLLCLTAGSGASAAVCLSPSEQPCLDVRLLFHLVPATSLCASLCPAARLFPIVVFTHRSFHFCYFPQLLPHPFFFVPPMFSSFLSTSASASTSISHCVLPFSVEPWYPSTGRLYCSKRTP